MLGRIVYLVGVVVLLMACTSTELPLEVPLEVPFESDLAEGEATAAVQHALSQRVNRDGDNCLGKTVAFYRDWNDWKEDYEGNGVWNVGLDSSFDRDCDTEFVYWRFYERTGSVGASTLPRSL